MASRLESRCTWHGRAPLTPIAAKPRRRCRLRSRERWRKAIEAVTAKWAKQRRAEERDRNARLRRADAIKAVQTPRKRTLKEVAYEVMEQAYLRASGGGTLPAKARQIMYKARPLILAQIEKDKFDDDHFTQTLLPDFMAQYPESRSAPIGRWFMTLAVT